jgi:hypothetical protein
MLKKTITYTDIDGEEVTEDFYFNLDKSEIAELEFSMEGGLAASLKLIVEGADHALILQTFKMLLTKSVGRREGKLFQKSPEIINYFTQTGAYSALFMEIATNAMKAAEFISGMVPKDMGEAALAEMKKNTAFAEVEASVQKTTEENSRVIPLPKKSSDYSTQELLAMTQEEFLALRKNASSNE